jgi:hypothetical protein
MMITDNGHDPSQYSHSALSLYRDCQLKYRYERLIHLVPRSGGVSHDLRYGQAGHEALALLYSGAPAKDVGYAFMNAYPADEYPATLPSWGQGKTRQNFLNALWAYINTQYQEDLRQWDVLEVERVQSSEGLGEYDHMLVPDLIVRDRQDGLVWLVDHKITGKYLRDLWSQHEMSSQIRMYVDQVRRRFGQVGGFIINGISLRHRSRAYTPRTGPDRGTQLPAGDWYDFGRMTYLPNEDCLRLERANVRATIDGINHSIATGTWTYNTNRCHGGTMFECPYYQICKPGWSWPRDQYAIEEYYRVVCAKQISGEQRCKLDADHEGDCSERAPVETALSQIVVEPEDDPYYMNVID